MYTVSGELTIMTSQTPPIKGNNGEGFRTSDLSLDSNGNLFVKTTLDITHDNKRGIIVLDAEQAELILKLLGIVEYAD
jgi:hypothetical protein